MRNLKSGRFREALGIGRRVRPWKELWFWAGVAIVGLDQLGKWVSRALADRAASPVGGILYCHVENHGLPLGVAADWPWARAVSIGLLSFWVVLLIAWLFTCGSLRAIAWLWLAGLASNLGDLVWHGPVTDWLCVDYAQSAGLTYGFAFNLGDVAMQVGEPTMLLLIGRVLWVHLTSNAEPSLTRS